VTFHSDWTDIDIHVPVFREYANATDRQNDVPIDPSLPAVTTADIGKWAFQIDLDTHFRLKSIGPLVWTPISTGGGGAIPTQDEGVTITPAPTAHNFVGAGVIVTDVAGVATISIPGSAGGGGNDKSIQFNNAGTLDGDDNNTWDDVAKKQTVLGDIEQAGGTETLPYTPNVISTTTTGTNPRFSVALGGFLYIVDSGTDDLRIFSLTDKTAPVQMNAIPLVIGNCRGCDISGNLLFVADTGSGGRLVCVDVSDKSAPFIVSAVVIGGSPRGVKVNGNTVYIANNTGSFGIQSIDVSDINAMALLDSFNTLNVAMRVEMDIVGNFLYAASPSGSDNFIILDISDRENLTQLSSRDAGSDVWAVKVQGEFAFVLVESIAGIKVFDISDPTDTGPEVASLAIHAGLASPRAINVQGDFAYVVDATNAKMVVVNIANPLNMKLISSDVSVGANPVALSTIGMFSYVLDNSGDAFRVIDLSGVKQQAAEIASLEAGIIDVRKDVKVGGTLTVATGVAVGPGGINTTGIVNGKNLTQLGLPMQRLPFNVVEVFDFDDMPNDANTIFPTSRFVYLVMAPISTDKWIQPPVSTGFADTFIISTNKEVNDITCTHTGAAPPQAFIDNQATNSNGGLRFINCIVQGAPGCTRRALDISSTSQVTGVLEFQDSTLQFFVTGSILDTVIFEGTQGTNFVDIGVLDFVDCALAIEDSFNNNNVDNNDVWLRFRSVSATVPTTVRLFNNLYSSHPGENFIDLDASLNEFSRIQLDRNSPHIFTPGTGGFYDAGSLDFSDPKVRASNNIGTPNSRSLIAYSSNDFAGATTPIVDTWTDIITLVLAEPNNQRLALTNTVKAEVTNNGLDTVLGELFAKISAFKSGMTATYKFRIVRTGDGSFSDGGGGLILVDSIGHGLVTGALVDIRDTTDYNGQNIAATVVDEDSYTIVDTYVSDQIGEWDTPVANNTAKLQIKTDLLTICDTWQIVLGPGQRTRPQVFGLASTIDPFTLEDLSVTFQE